MAKTDKKNEKKLPPEDTAEFWKYIDKVKKYYRWFKWGGVVAIPLVILLPATIILLPGVFYFGMWIQHRYMKKALMVIVVDESKET